MSYNIKIAQFEGPFDLLLFFIERDELDIQNIPIAKITEDFLGYLRRLEAMNLDVASEFILVAATLMRIKARMLLPRREIDEQGNEIDPRKELVDRLLEYKRYKDVLDELRALEEARQQKEHRGNVVSDLQQVANKAMAEAEMESLTLFRLLKAFERVMQGFKERQVVHTITAYPYTIEQQRNRILEQVQGRGRVDFKEVFEACENRLHAIYSFLALLEMLALQMVDITIGEGVNNFWIIELSVNY